MTSNQTLLGKNTLKLQTVTPVKYKGELESAILSYAQPKPNSHLVDLDFLPKYKLWKYNTKIEKYRKDSLHEKIVKHKVEPPSLIDSFLIKKSEANMKQFMLNAGYPYAQVSSRIEETSNPKIKNVAYTVNAGKNYIIEKVKPDTDNGTLLFIMSKNMETSYLRKGEPFTYFNCGLERERLYKLFRNSGLYDFKMDNITFLIDTIDRSSLVKLTDDPFEQSFNFDTTRKESNTINVKIQFEQTKDSTYLTTYFIEDVFVRINDIYTHKVNVGETNNILDHIHFSYNTLPVNRNVIARNIFIQQGKYFNTDDMEATINRLHQLGVFQFVNVIFKKIDDKPSKLNCYITLNTSAKMDATLQGDISTSDGDYFLGFGGSLIYRNRNLFSGANQMSLRTSYSTEFRNDNLFTGKKQFYLSGNNFGITSEFSFPKFIVPFRQTIFNKKTAPYTVLSLNYSMIQRLRNYTIINSTGSFGYSWKETKKKSWRLNPAFLTVTKVPEGLLSESFENKINTNPYLKNIFSDNNIWGENVTFEFKNNPDNLLRNTTAIKVLFEEAGTLLKGFDYLYYKVSNNHINSIARYVKLEADFRRYLNFKKSQWANRIMIGIGVPVAGTGALPYIKRYSAGGAFSNRGWQARTLGPGRSIDSTFQTDNAFIDRTGDLKFEANTEFRTNLLKLFSGVINIKGAAFLDAGNIWMFNKSPDIVGGEFDLNYLWQDIAISGGLGLRLDFSFFVFRIDVGYPIKQPQISTNSGFAFNTLKLKSGVLNIAIGYPF